MNRNLVSGNLFEKSAIKSVYESGKLVLSLNEKFVEKDYFVKEWSNCVPLTR